eukprot:CAMPEP_0176463802 /NCGR_PEP_ID=MMETSP0127-20121128/36115_1 /TAXON_ID=938130 /ORGANISM="Platyophrya macrostoma, Strain WH" /LENGTH=433 /DNA_ID=CAMNT_0017856051 /DNA_START=31 /DNA_END=1332 /DNA_ORIENTATION=-
MTSPPAWSMGNSRRDGSWQNSRDAPGPGAYNIIADNKKFHAPAYKIGGASRGNDNMNDVPGPGKKTFGGPKYHFGGKHGNSMYQNSEAPGPGAYQTDRPKGTELRAPAYTMSGKHSFNNQDEVPGPGAYNTNTRILNKSMPATRMGTAKRSGLELNNDTPGPGAYNFAKQTAFGRKSPMTVFGTSQRSDALGSGEIPGPGAYSFPSSSVKKNGGITMMPKRDLHLHDDDIPGKYELRERATAIMKKDPRTVIGTASRDGLYRKSDTPGPGAYQAKDLYKTNPPRTKLGTSKRQPLNSAEDIPGPGAYQIKTSSFIGPKYTMSSKHDDFLGQRGDIPGPGAYSSSTNLGKGKQIIFGSEKRDGFGKVEEGPGPGYYNLGAKWKGPLGVIGHEKRGAGFGGSGDPGPGQYNIPSKIADVPSYVFPDKNKLKIRPL